MAAEVCLLLMQSLTGDCEATVPEGSSSPPVIAYQRVAITGDEPAIAAAIAPPAAATVPRFGSPEGCLGGRVTSPPNCQRAAGIPAGATATVQPVPAARSRPTPVITGDLTTPAVVSIPRATPTATLPSLWQPQFTPPPPSTELAPQPARPRPVSGAQFYRQRELALQAGRLYTRLSPSQFAEQWSQATRQPTYQDWLQLLRREAQAAAAGQGQNRLDIVLGDSLGLWLPPEMLPRDRLWLNQSISGDTTAHILPRLSAFAITRPTTIHLLAGANDLKTDVPEAQIVNNLRLIVQRLQQQQPQARIIVYSVLPTRRAEVTNDRVRSLNAQISAMAQQTGAVFENVHPQFQDAGGALRPELTTDGLHLNERGYALWQRAIVASAR